MLLGVTVAFALAVLAWEASQVAPWGAELTEEAGAGALALARDRAAAVATTLPHPPGASAGSSAGVVDGAEADGAGAVAGAVGSTFRNLTAVPKPRATGGAFHFDNVCVGTTSRKVAVFYYTDSGSVPDEVTKGPLRAWVAHRALPAAQWAVDSARTGLHRGETLLFASHGNPAHCLCDVTFSVLLDLYERGLWSRKKDDVLVRRYVLSSINTAGTEDPFRSCANRKSWCCHLLDLAGLVSAEGRVKVPWKRPSDKDKDDVLACFERLVVPRFMRNRFPLDPDDLTTPGMQAMVEYLTGTINNVETFPTNVLTLLRERLSRRNLDLFPGGLDRAWPSPRSGAVVLYDRKDAKRRRLENSRAVAAAMRKDLALPVRHLGADWAALSPREQAKLYFGASVLVTPHGGHMANLIYAKRATLVLEFECDDDEALEPSLELLTNSDDVWGKMTWFSTWTRRIGFKHIFTPANPTCNGHDTRALNMDPAYVTRLLKSRGGL